MGVGGDADVCAAIGVAATLQEQPIDVIVVVDNSLSMVDELRAVERNISGYFSEVLDEAGVDYRLVLVSNHRETLLNFSSICIASPLSGLLQCPAVAPGSTERFYHYSVEVGSGDALQVLLDSYSAPIPAGRQNEHGPADKGWSSWLRAGAEPVFLVVSDDDSELGTDAFLDGLVALDPGRFGEFAQSPKFVWHSITGIAEQPADPTAAYGPEEPLQVDVCTGNSNRVQNAGLVYQELAQRTHGLRLPICQFGAYDVVFEQIASDVVQVGATACEFEIPAPPQGQTVVLDNIALSITGGLGGAVELRQVTGPQACEQDGFFIAPDSQEIVLCEQSCALLRAIRDVAVEVLFTCEDASP